LPNREIEVSGVGSGVNNRYVELSPIQGHNGGVKLQDRWQFHGSTAIAVAPGRTALKISAVMWLPRSGGVMTRSLASILVLVVFPSLLVAQTGSRDNCDL